MVPPAFRPFDFRNEGKCERKRTKKHRPAVRRPRLQMADARSWRWLFSCSSRSSVTNCFAVPASRVAKIRLFFLVSSDWDPVHDVYVVRAAVHFRHNSLVSSAIALTLPCPSASAVPQFISPNSRRFACASRSSCSSNFSPPCPASFSACGEFYCDGAVFARPFFSPLLQKYIRLPALFQRPDLRCLFSLMASEELLSR